VSGVTCAPSRATATHEPGESSTFVEAMVQAQEPDAAYTVTWGPETLGYFVRFNYATNVGIEDENRDTAVRELLRDVRFRKALSYATDREGIAQSIMRGPFLRAWRAALSGCPISIRNRSCTIPSMSPLPISSSMRSG